MLPNLFDRSLQLDGTLTLEPGDHPDGDRQAQQVGHQFTDRSFAQAIRPGQDAEDGPEPRAESPLGYPRRQSCAGRSAAIRADQTVELVFIDDGANGRHFSDLVTDRFGVIVLEVLTALPALRRLALDHLAKLFGWNQGANTTEVTGLPAPFLARGRIRGRGFGGVGRVLIDPFLQSGDPLFQ